MAEKKEKKLDPETLEGVVIENVGAPSTVVVVAVPEAPPPPVSEDDAIKAACERAAGGDGTTVLGVGGGYNLPSPGQDDDWRARLAEADARLSAAAAAADAAVKRRIEDDSSSSKTP